jgi:hypothetical protein
MEFLVLCRLYQKSDFISSYFPPKEKNWRCLHESFTGVSQYGKDQHAGFAIGPGVRGRSYPERRARNKIG